MIKLYNKTKKRKGIKCNKKIKNDKVKGYGKKIRLKNTADTVKYMKALTSNC